jgi:hypothetical protein
MTFVLRPAWAVQERNEALCGTGFFTNFMEYRCTELGDISDEGLPGSLSDSQSERADALLSKFQLVLDDASSSGAGDVGETPATDEAQSGVGVEPRPTTKARQRQQR